MIQFTFDLKPTSEQLVFDIHDDKRQIYVRCMYDTGATISVWTKSEETLFKTFDVRPTKFYSKVTGYDDKEYNMLPVYAIDLRMGKYSLINIPVVVFPNKSNSSMLNISTYVI